MPEHGRPGQVGRGHVGPAQAVQAARRVGQVGGALAVEVGQQGQATRVRDRPACGQAVEAGQVGAEHGWPSR